MDPAIRTDGLRKAYGDVQALDGLTFEVDRGEFFGLLGPNGAGKTTFINALVGLVRTDGGTAEVFGFDVESEYRRARDRIGLAPQEFNVDRFFPIHEVLEHKAGYHGVPQGEAERLCDRVAIVDSGRIVEVSTPDELRSRGTDQVHLTLSERPAAVPALDVEGVVETRLEGSTLVVTAQGGGTVAPDLLRELEYEGYDVLDLDIRRASLEEVFVDMTRTDEAAEPMGVIQ